MVDTMGVGDGGRGNGEKLLPSPVDCNAETALHQLAHVTGHSCLCFVLALSGCSICSKACVKHLPPHANNLEHRDGNQTKDSTALSLQTCRPVMLPYFILSCSSSI